MAYFMKLKSDVFECLKGFKDLSKNQSGGKNKILCTDNWGKYVNKYVQKHCAGPYIPSLPLSAGPYILTHLACLGGSENHLIISLSTTIGE